MLTHEATRAATELREIRRRDKLEPLTAEAALGPPAPAVWRALWQAEIDGPFSDHRETFAQR